MTPADVCPFNMDVLSDSSRYWTFFSVETCSFEKVEELEKGGKEGTRHEVLQMTFIQRTPRSWTSS